MAKKEKTSNEIPVSTVDDLNTLFKSLLKQHNNIVPDSALFGEEELGAAVTKYIPTGSIGLDTIISNRADMGGWPCGRVVELYGEQAYGKSSICFQAMANTQKEGGIVIFFDIEHAASESLMEGYGIDVTKILYSNLDKVEEIFDAMQQNLTTIINTPAFKDVPVLIVIDSLAAMKSRKLEEGSFDYNMNTQAEFAKILGSALKRMISYLGKANACLIIINQLRDKVGTIGADTKFAPGGNALKFYATVRCRLLGKKMITTKEEITGNEVPIGAEVTVRTDKNKLGPPIRSVDFELHFTTGIYEYENWFFYLKNMGYCSQGGAWWTFTERFPMTDYQGKKFQKSDIETLLEDGEFHDMCVKLIKEGFVRPGGRQLLEEQIAAANIKE